MTTPADETKSTCQLEQRPAQRLHSSLTGHHLVLLERLASWPCVPRLVCYRLTKRQPSPFKLVSFRRCVIGMPVCRFIIASPLPTSSNPSPRADTSPAPRRWQTQPVHGSHHVLGFLITKDILNRPFCDKFIPLPDNPSERERPDVPRLPPAAPPARVRPDQSG